MADPQTEVPLLKSIVISLGGSPIGDTEVPLLRQIVLLLDGGAGGGAQLPPQAGNAGKYLTTDGTDASWQNIPGGVSSVGLSMPGGFSVANSPVTGSGTLAVTTSINGLVKANGTDFSAAVAGTDYLTPTGNGSGLTGLTATQVGLGNVTNDAQTRAAIVPNTAPAAGQILAGNAGGTAYAPVAMSGDATLASTGSLTIASNAITTGKILNEAVTYPKLPNQAEATVLGRAAGAGTGSPVALTAAQLAAILATDGSYMLKSVYDSQNLGRITGLAGSNSGPNTGGQGGNLDFRGGDATGGGNGGAGGLIWMYGGGPGENSGSLLMYGGEGNQGGDIATNGDSSGPGGSINTSNGGGSINTTGTGSIQLGVSGTRTTLTGTATTDRAIALPDAAGTVLLYQTLPTGSILNRVVTTGTGASTTSQIPFDNSPPQNNEGTEYLTVTITPTSASSKLRISFNAWCSAALLTGCVVALFQDSTADALATKIVTVGATDYNYDITLEYEMTAGTTSATTFKLRFGPTGATTAYLMQSSADPFGSAKQANLTVTEYKA